MKGPVRHVLRKIVNEDGEWEPDENGTPTVAQGESRTIGRERAGTAWKTTISCAGRCVATK